MILVFVILDRLYIFYCLRDYLFLTEKMNDQTYSWGIIGCGNVTEIKSGPAYQKIEGFKIHAVMRRDYKKALSYAYRHNIPVVHRDANSLIEDPNIDAVYIATPPDTHAFYALKVAAVGKVCCIEKPMAPSFEECKKVVQAFAVKKIPLFVAYYRRSLPRFEKVKTWLQEKQIGQIRHVSWQFAKPINAIDKAKKYNWRTDEKIAPGGYFDDLASHGIDLLIYLLGPIKTANGLATNQQGLYSAKDAVVGNWIHNSGITGSGSWNFGAEKRTDKVEIFGDRGSICFAVFAEELLELHKEGKRHLIRIHNPNPIQLNHVENMAKTLFLDATHPSTGTTAMHTTWVLEKLMGK